MKPRPIQEHIYVNKIQFYKKDVWEFDFIKKQTWWKIILKERENHLIKNKDLPVDLNEVILLEIGCGRERGENID